MISLSSSQTTKQGQNSHRIRVLIVDDQKAVRYKLQTTLTTVDDLEIVGIAEDGHQAIAMIERFRPDVLLMDIEMPKMNGIQVTQIATKQFPQIKILILTTHEKEEYVQKIVSSGADGYLLKQTNVLDLLTAILSVYKGYSHFSPGILKKAQLSPSINPVWSQKYTSVPAKLESVNRQAKPVEDSGIVNKLNSAISRNLKRLSESRNQRLLILALSATAITVATLVYGISRTTAIDSKPESAPAATPPATIPDRRISALGRIEPTTDIIKISVPAALSNDRVRELLVKRGDRVKTGQTIAILDSRLRLENELVEAKAQLKVSQAKLEQVKAGVSSGEITAQESEILRLQQGLKGEIEIQQAVIARRQAEVNDAQVDYQRYLSLYQQKAVAASELDIRKLSLATAQTQIEESEGAKNQKIAQLQSEIKQAQANLDKIAIVRPTDIAVAQSEVDQEIVAVKKAQDALDEAYIKAPTAGRIFDLEAKPGEVVGTDGIVKMGETSQMEVVAEVYESDISKVKVGKKVKVISDSLTKQLQGTVSQIGLQVVQQEVTSGDSGENLDRKVIEVRIKLNPEDSQKVSDLTNLQVEVLI